MDMNESSTRDGTGRLAHHGRGGELFVVFVVNLLLRIVTLGLYHFWAKTRVRRYLWTQTSFDGERLEYTGTGLELLVGFVKALVILMGGVLLVAAALSQLEALALPLVIAIYFGFPVLAGFALYGARRYRLTRTRLRGIRFGLDGSGWDHGLKLLGYGLLTVLTLGLYTPYMRMKLAGNLYNNTRFGSERFTFDGDGRDLFGRFLLAVLLTLPTLGLVWVWYQAAEFRYTLSRLRVGDIAFELAESDMSLAWFFVTNALMVMLTLGLGLPWVMVRTLRHLGEQMVISGQLDYAAIRQAQEESEATGEGLAEALDLGAF